MSSPAGWYPQPDGQQRYWDGDQWTEHFAPGVLVSLPVSTPDVSRGSALDARPAYKGFGGGIELSDDTMVIRKTGMAARTLGVVGERRIPLAAVADVRFKDATRLVNGWIQLVLGDEVPGKALASDPNTIVFAHASQSAFQELRGRLMAVIDTNREQGVNASDIVYDRPAPSRLEKQQGKMQAEKRGWRGRTSAANAPESSSIGIEQPSVSPPAAPEKNVKGDDLRADIAAARSLMQTKIGAGREIKKLPGYLWDDELVERMTAGQYGPGQGLVILTNRRLFFLKDGLMSKASEDFPMDKVSSVQWSSGMLLGTITIFASGNKAEIANVNKYDGKAIVDLIRQRLARRSTTRAPDPASVQSAGVDPLDQLKRLGELRDAGVLTQEEFDSKKAEILRRM